MAVYTQLSLDEATVVTRAHGLGPATRLEPIAAGSVNTNYFVAGDFGRLFLRVYEEQEASGVAYEWALLDHLTRASVPVPARVVGPPPGDCRVHGKPTALFAVVGGRELRQAEVNPVLAAAVGGALGQVHHAVRDYGWKREGRFRRGDLRDRLDGAARHGRPELVDTLARLHAVLDELDATEPRGLPTGVTHGDLFRDNVRFEGTRIAALLDWESAAEGVFAYDLAVTMLAHCYGGDFDFALASAMVRGYDARRPLRDEEWLALRFHARAAAARFATTRITDFYLRDGGVGERVMKDYRRFLARLDAVTSLSAEEFAERLRAR